jgi:hypothetical protein
VCVLRGQAKETDTEHIHTSCVCNRPAELSPNWELVIG